MMKARVYLVATALFLLIPSVGQFVPTPASGAAAGTARFDLGALPQSIGDHAVRADQLLEEAVLAQIRPEAYVMRLFTAPDQAPVWVYAALYADAVAIGAHDPAICYPAQGWAITDDRDVRVELDGGHELRARTLLTTRAGQGERVLYWFQPAGRWPGGAAFEQLWRSVDALRGTPQYAFVRLSTPDVDPDGDGDRLLRRFARALAPAVRGAVDGAHGDAP